MKNHFDYHISTLHAKKVTMTTNRLSDAHTRDRALDPRQSFIVQAPAGSGKTELLTQRFLVLLSHVNIPEEILAITFTKKSAQEMRARIINTLKNAAYAVTEPEQEHAKKTWRLAKNVLQRDQQLQWNLLSNPNRLRIQTIDSFNASLTKHLPILSQFGASPEIADQPVQLYTEAVQEFLTHLEENVEWADAIAHLLTHMDNDLSKVQSLLVTMLGKRDQWFQHILLNANDPHLRERLESYLHNIIHETLSKLYETFPPEYTDELINLIQHASQNLLAEKSQSRITHCADLTDLPIDDISDLDYWHGIADFLLTKDNTWRKSYTIREGFIAPGKNAALKEAKDRVLKLVAELSEHEELRNAFQELRELPLSQYADSQWEILQSLHTVLHVVVAQLRIVFQKYGKIDYIENALAALTALGTEESPTDIALALDYRIQHILVDEFQDTASMQYKLLVKLTTGWEPNDGRTLFVVGDPMQSIYRFREAEVGLFIRARKLGLGHIYLEPLTLSVNFRSTFGIINWVNSHFQRMLPQFENIANGAVSYSQSTASKTEQTNEDSVVLHPFINGDAHSQQANKIIDLIIQTKKEKPNGTIAILVRTRTHLKSIIPALKANRLSFRAIKIDPLNLRPTIQDLMALTRALLHPADRIAWLSVLRAPWCGLTLNDLLLLSGTDANISLWKQLQSPAVIASLSTDGQARLSRILPILKTKVSERRRLTLRLWIESTWILLGGPACVESQSDLEDTNAYFDLLERLDNGGNLSHLDTLNETVTQLYAAADNQADETLQIMTIHNAKGLEFDTVILPHLERKPSGDDKQLLLWMQRPREDDDSDLIIAPVNAIGGESDSIYDYIKQQVKIKAKYEDGRLLYVAATRAKEKLHILFSLEERKTKDGTELKATANSLLEKLWPAIKDNLPISSSSAVEIIKDKTETCLLSRLTTEWRNPIQETNNPTNLAFHQQSNGFLLPETTPRIIGTLIHTIFQNLSKLGFSWWDEKTITIQNTYLKKQLLRAGLLPKNINNAINSIQRAILNAKKDQRAQWILQPHSEANSEFSVTAIINDEIRPLIIDRTFIDEAGTRWIIDYKTSVSETEHVDVFLKKEKKKYEEQLHEYYHAIKQMDSRPIRIGLYFPLIPAWYEWSFEPIPATST